MLSYVSFPDLRCFLFIVRTKDDPCLVDGHVHRLGQRLVMAKEMPSPYPHSSLRLLALLHHHNKSLVTQVSPDSSSIRVNGSPATYLFTGFRSRVDLRTTGGSSGSCPSRGAEY